MALRRPQQVSLSQLQCQALRAQCCLGVAVIPLKYPISAGGATKTTLGETWGSLMDWRGSATCKASALMPVGTSCLPSLVLHPAFLSAKLWEPGNDSRIGLTMQMHMCMPHSQPGVTPLRIIGDSSGGPDTVARVSATSLSSSSEPSSLADRISLGFAHPRPLSNTGEFPLQKEQRSICQWVYFVTAAALAVQFLFGSWKCEPHTPNPFNDLTPPNTHTCKNLKAICYAQERPLPLKVYKEKNPSTVKAFNYLFLITQAKHDYILGFKKLTQSIQNSRLPCPK